MLPLFVLAAPAMARAAGLHWARSRWAALGFGAVAAGLFVIDVPYAVGVLFGGVGPFPAVELKLGCIGDAIRYTASLGPAYFCGPEAEVHRVGPGPVVAIVMVVVVLGVGIALWVRRRWPWLALTAGAIVHRCGRRAGLGHVRAARGERRRDRVRGGADRGRAALRGRRAAT